MRNFEDLIDAFGGLVGTLILVVAGIALLVFFWGIAKYIAAAGSEEGRDRAKNVMLWGIIALFVLVSVWGIVSFFKGEFSLDITDPDVRGGGTVF